MNEYLRNFYDLYSDNDELVKKAVFEKKDWILKSFYLPITLDISKDEEGNSHFYELEDVLKDRIALKPFPFIIKELEGITSQFSYLLLFDKPEREDTLYWLKYDFTTIDDHEYRDLLANIFPRMNEEELELDKKDPEPFLSLMKTMMIGDPSESIIIISKLQRESSFIRAPKLLEIICKKEAVKEVKDTLLRLAIEKDAVYTEVE